MTDGSSPQEWVQAWLRGLTRMLWRNLFYAGVIIGGIYSLMRLKAVVISLFIAATLAYIMRPMASWLTRQDLFIIPHDALGSLWARMTRPIRALFYKHAPPPNGPVRLSLYTRRVIATLYVLIFLFVVGWYSFRFMVDPFVLEIKAVLANWPDYRAKLEQYGEDARKWYETNVQPEWRARFEEALRQGGTEGDLQKRVSEGLVAIVRKTSEFAHYIVEIVLLPVLAFYFALESKKLKHEFVGTLPRRSRREVLRMIREFNLIMYSFVVGQAILCAIAGVVVGVGLWLLQMKYPITLGLLAGFTRAIPIIGPILGGIPIIALALVTKGVGVALGVLIFFTFLHFAESKFIMPILIGERMKLHPVVIIVVLLIGQEFGGLIGMFFAAPIAALIRVIVRRYWLQNHRRGVLRPPHLRPRDTAVEKKTLHVE